MTATTINFLGKILCCPPIVNSPKGKPQATSTVIVAITPNNTAPNIENINQYPPLANPRKIQKISATVGRILVSDKTFNIPAIANHWRHAQNVGFENPTYKIIPSHNTMKSAMRPILPAILIICISIWSNMAMWRKFPIGGFPRFKAV